MNINDAAEIVKPLYTPNCEHYKKDCEFPEVFDEEEDDDIKEQVQNEPR